MRTLYDLVSRVLDARDGYNDPTSMRRALRAAIWGADQVTQRHAWTDYHTQSTHVLSAPVNVTVDIDGQGKLTLAEGSFPSWMAEASVRIGHELFVVATRDSNTQAKLDNYSGPASTDQSVTIVHDRMVLRDDLRHVYEVKNLRDDLTLIFVSPAPFYAHQSNQNGTPGQPCVFTTARDSQPGRMRTELRVSPAPISAMTFRIAYYRVARKATVLHECKATIGDDHSLVTIDKPLRVADYHGLTLSLAANNQRPDAELGFSVADANPAIAELLVEEIETTTTLRLAAEYAELSNRGAMLTQLLDLPPHTHEAAAMYAEAKYLQIGNGSHGDFWQTIQMADAELRTAMEQESTLSRQHSRGSRAAIYTAPEKIVMEMP